MIHQEHSNAMLLAKVRKRKRLDVRAWNPSTAVLNAAVMDCTGMVLPQHRRPGLRAALLQRVL